MSSIAIFEANKTPQYIPSNVVPEDYSGRNDVVIDPDVRQVAGLPLKYWKLVNGSVEAMTAQEQAAVDAAEAAANLQAAQSGGISLIDNLDGISLRAIASILIDENNILRQRDRDRATDVAAATSLANLQTRWAARAALNDRTLDQAKTAYKNAIQSGSVDQ